MNDHSALKALLRSNEGEIPHLYLDSYGFVTIGVGHKFESRDELLLVEGWVCRTTRQPAASDQILAEWDNVIRVKSGLLAERYAEWTRLDLLPESIDHLLDRDIAEKELSVRMAFPPYTTFPAPAQDALLDMAFNLGVNGLVMKFPHLRAAALSNPPDWQRCAAECRRAAPVSDARNTATRNLFESALA